MLLIANTDDTRSMISQNIITTLCVKILYNQ
jgi:hypothetical protein